MYANTGEFVESCTAIIEHFDGSLELLRWRKQEGQHQEALSVEGQAEWNVWRGK